VGMIAATHDIAVQAGATWRETITYKDKTSGNPIDLTGWSARMQLRERTDGSIVELDITTANGRIEVDGPDGVIRIHVLAEDTTPLAKNNARTNYVYGLELFNGDPEDVISLLTGAVTVYPEVVRG